MREYRFLRSGFYSAYGTLTLALISAIFLCAPLGQWLVEGELQLEFLLPSAVLLFFWYMRLRPVKSVKIFGTGKVELSRGVGRVEVQLQDIERIYPFLRASRRDFLMKHSKGVEYLLEDPTLVAVLAADLVELNPNIELRSVPEPPGREKLGEEEAAERGASYAG